jgi:hypothetical protein
MKLRARAGEPKTTLALLDRFKSELVVIEPPRSVEVRSRYVTISGLKECSYVEKR